MINKETDLNASDTESSVLFAFFFEEHAFKNFAFDKVNSRKTEALPGFRD